MSEYRLEVSHWTRSRDGDDWVDSEYWVMFQSLSEAMERVERISDPLNKTLIEVRLYNMTDSKDLIYRKDYISGKVEDFWGISLLFLTLITTTGSISDGYED